MIDGLNFNVSPEELADYLNNADAALRYQSLRASKDETLREYAARIVYLEFKERNHQEERELEILNKHPGFRDVAARVSELEEKPSLTQIEGLEYYTIRQRDFKKYARDICAIQSKYDHDIPLSAQEERAAELWNRKLSDSAFIMAALECKEEPLEDDEKNDLIKLYLKKACGVVNEPTDKILKNGIFSYNPQRDCERADTYYGNDATINRELSSLHAIYMYVNNAAMELTKTHIYRQTNKALISNEQNEPPTKRLKTYSFFETRNKIYNKVMEKKSKSVQLTIALALSKYLFDHSPEINDNAPKPYQYDITELNEKKQYLLDEITEGRLALRTDHFLNTEFQITLALDLKKMQDEIAKTYRMG